MVTLMLTWLMACECQPHAAQERTEQAFKVILTRLEIMAIQYRCLVPGDHFVSEYYLLMDPAERARRASDAWGNEIFLVVRDDGSGGLHIQIIAPARDAKLFTQDDIARVVHFEDTPACV